MRLLYAREFALHVKLFRKISDQAIGSYFIQISRWEIHTESC